LAPVKRTLAVLVTAFAAHGAGASACPPPAIYERPAPPETAPEPMLPDESPADYARRMARDRADQAVIAAAAAPIIPRGMDEDQPWYDHRLRTMANADGMRRQPGESDSDFSARVQLWAAALADRIAAAKAVAQQQARRDQTAAQAKWIDSHDTVIIARAVSRKRIGASLYLGQQSKVMFAPIAWIKGRPRGVAFAMRHYGDTSCGPIGPRSAEARVGDIWAFFFKGGKPAQASLGNELPAAAFLEPRLIARANAE
jgi:hypothetical protein